MVNKPVFISFKPIKLLLSSTLYNIIRFDTRNMLEQEISCCIAGADNITPFDMPPLLTHMRIRKGACTAPTAGLYK